MLRARPRGRGNARARYAHELQREPEFSSVRSRTRDEIDPRGAAGRLSSAARRLLDAPYRMGHDGPSDQALKQRSSQVRFDRYCSWPGQACGYKVGHSEINRQREKSKTALGAKYDLKAFDDTVVLGGNVPLDVLAKNVDEYIRTAKGR